MSLLHQVLQDIDRREARSLALPGQLSLPAEAAERRYFMPALLSLAVLTAAGLWLFVDQQNSSVVQPSVRAAVLAADKITTAEKAAPLITPDVSYIALVSMPERPLAAINSEAEKPAQIQAAEVNEPVVQEDEVRTVELSPAVMPVQVAEQNSAVIKQPAATQPPGQEKNVAEKKASTVEQHQTTAPAVSVQRSETAAQLAYREALDASRQGRFALALNRIDRAIAADPQAAYLALRLRILLEQKNADAFIAFFREHQQLQDVQWLSVAAPGLHMLGQAAMAIPPYQQLVVSEPDEVKWPLALASAWEAEQKPAPARAVLVNVLKHYPLTRSQQQWVEQRIEVLSGNSGS